MAFFESLRSGWKYSAGQLQEWSPFHFFFDAGLTFVISVGFGWGLQMPLALQIAFGIGVLVTVTAAIGLYHHSTLARLSGISKRLHELANNLNISGFSAMPQVQMGPKRDPLTEPIAELRAMLKPQFVSDYEKCIEAKEPTVAAKLYLQSLANTLSRSHLRTE